MCRVKIEVKNICSICSGVGFELGEVIVEGLDTHAECIPCDNRKGTGEIE